MRHNGEIFHCSHFREFLCYVATRWKPPLWPAELFIRSVSPTFPLRLVYVSLTFRLLYAQWVPGISGSKPASSQNCPKRGYLVHRHLTLKVKCQLKAWFRSQPKKPIYRLERFWYTSDVIMGRYPTSHPSYYLGFNLEGQVTAQRSYLRSLPRNPSRLLWPFWYECWALTQFWELSRTQFLDIKFGLQDDPKNNI